jgi:hypothetical protein
VWLEAVPQADERQFVHITVLNQYQAWPLVGVLSDVATTSGVGVRRLLLSTRGSLGQGLLQAAARVAFKGWTVPQLKRLVGAAGLSVIGESLPTLETPLLRLLIGRSLPDLSEDEIDSIIATRKKPAATSTTISPGIKPEDLAVVEEVLAADIGEVGDMVEKGAARAKKAGKAPATSASSTSASTTMGPEASAAAAAAPAAPVPPAAEPQPAVSTPVEIPPTSTAASGTGGPFAIRPSDGDKFSRDEASTLLPACAGCSVSIHSGAAWVVVYRGRSTPGKKSTTHTWGPTTGLSHSQALRACLLWVWSVHEECTGEICPFDFDDVL